MSVIVKYDYGISKQIRVPPEYSEYLNNIWCKGGKGELLSVCERFTFPTSSSELLDEFDKLSTDEELIVKLTVFPPRFREQNNKSQRSPSDLFRSGNSRKWNASQ